MPEQVAPMAGSSPGQIDLWLWTRAALRELPLARPEWLPSHEQARIERLRPLAHDDALRLRCALRAALSTCSDQAPDQLVFSLGSHGKPVLVSSPSLAFSLSHAGDRVLLAVSREGPVGVDLERVRQTPRDELAGRLFGPHAWSRYQALSACARSAAFAQAWTEREALVKAMGLGIGDGWSLCWTLFESAPLQVSSPGPGQVGGWQVSALPMGSGWAATVCSVVPIRRLHWRQCLGARHPVFGAMALACRT